MKKRKLYKFRIPIGDWSNDGHGQYDDHLIESNQPLEKVRELYLQACDKIGFSLDGGYINKDLTPFADYQDSKFSVETLDALLNFGVRIDKEAIEYIREQESTDGQELFCDIILAFICTQDENLILKRIPSDEEFPMFQFFGFDNKKRHIGYFGYGLFY